MDGESRWRLRSTVTMPSTDTSATPQRTTLQAYVPDKPPQTRVFDPTREPPDNWKPLW